MLKILWQRKRSLNGQRESARNYPMRTESSIERPADTEYDRNERASDRRTESSPENRQTRCTRIAVDGMKTLNGQRESTMRLPIDERH